MRKMTKLLRRIYRSFQYRHHYREKRNEAKFYQELLTEMLETNMQIHTELKALKRAIKLYRRKSISAHRPQSEMI